MRLEVHPLEWSDINIFCKWIQHYKKKKLNFFFNQVKTQEDFWSWYKDVYLKPYKDDIEKWLIFYLNGKRVGAANFSGCAEECQVQIFMAPRWKSKGLGSLFLLLSEKWMKKEYKDIDYLWAEVDYNNIASAKTFEALNYYRRICGDYSKYLKHE